MRARVRVCMCVCVCAYVYDILCNDDGDSQRVGANGYTSVGIEVGRHTVCVCVCACVWTKHGCSLETLLSDVSNCGTRHSTRERRLASFSPNHQTFSQFVTLV